MRLNLPVHNCCFAIVGLLLLINGSCKTRNSVWLDTLTSQINRDSDNIIPLDTSLLRFMVNYHIPALSITLAKDEKIIYAKTFGLANLSDGKEANNESLFRIAGLSTPITSLAIKRLVGLGRISFDSKVFGEGSILGTRYGHKPYAFLLTEITIADLLNHTSGAWSGVDDVISRYDSRGLFSSKDSVLSWILDHTQMKDLPGTVFNFSYTGYFILGMVIEKITGKSYEEWVQENILKPCGINDMEVEKDSSQSTHEVNHYKDLSWPRYNGDIDENLFLSRADAALGWIASSTDLVRLMLKYKNMDSLNPGMMPTDSLPKLSPPKNRLDVAPDWVYVHASDSWWEQFDMYGTTAVLVRSSKGFYWVILINTYRPDMPNYFRDIDTVINKTMDNTAIHWETKR